ncbi:MAG: hypothetical protein K6C36_09385 [Clostridia bacterium]|nr:hypothetical protein [Clostridia bacterium]
MFPRNTVSRAVQCVIPALCLLLLCSCASPLTGPENLIRAPKLTGENAAIQKAFEESVDAGAKLCAPSAGQYRSAFVRYDYDLDGVEEALAFYTAADAPLLCRVNFLDEDPSDGWRSVADVAGEGAEVYETDFVDLDADGVLEIVVGWAQSDSPSDCVMSVYALEKTAVSFTISEAMTRRYAAKLFVDIDSDRRREIVVCDYDRTVAESSFYCEVLKLKKIGDGKKVEKVGSARLSPDISSILGFATDTSDGKFRIYIDAVSTGGRYFTDIAVYDGSEKEFSVPSELNGVSLVLLTARSIPLLCADTDSDGRVEVPRFTYVSRGTGDDRQLTELYMPSVFTGDGFEAEDTYFVNYTAHYIFRIPPILLENSDISYSVDMSRLEFYSDDYLERPLLFISSANIGEESSGGLPEPEANEKRGFLSFGESRLMISVFSAGESIGLTRGMIEDAIENLDDGSPIIAAQRAVRS